MIINIIALYLFLLAASIGFWVILSSNWIWSIAAIAGFVASAGLFMRKRWGQYLWYLIAFFASAGWITMTVYTLSNSINPIFEHLDQLIISLMPGIFWLFSWIAGSYVVNIRFRKI